MKYDIILFDADETLFDFDQSEYNALKDCFEKNSLDFSDKIYNEYHEINKSLWSAFEQNKIEKSELVIERFRLIIKNHGYTPDPEKFNLDYADALSRQCILFPGAAELCRKLSENAKLYIVTNGVRTTQMRRFHASPITSFISDIFVSEEIGTQKPDKKYFDVVFSRIPNFDPSRTIIVGDSLSSDIRGASNAGIASCWYNPHFFPNSSETVPTFTAGSYADVESIVFGRCSRTVPCGYKSEHTPYTHTNKNVLVLLPADKELRERFRQAAPGYEFSFKELGDKSIPKLAGECEVVVGQAPIEALNNSGNLRVVQLCMAGTEPYSLPGMLPDCVELTNATGAFGLAVSEHMFATLLCLYKKLHLYRDNMKDAKWLDHGVVKTLKGATVLTLGLGDIGESFAKMASALGAYTIGVRRSNTNKPDFLDELVLGDKLDEVLPRADVTALVLPATKDTIGIMSRERLFRMKKGAVLINAGRGNAVDTDALCDALNCGRLSGASVDVTDPEPLPSDHPLWCCDNALITPHVSGFYHLKNTYLNIADICVENLRRYAHDEALKSIVDKSTGYAKK